MKRRRLLIVAVMLLALGNIWYFSGQIESLLSTRRAEPLDTRPPLTRREAFAIYPSAVRVNLLVKNARLEGPEASTNPNGVNLNLLQRQEFERAITKVIELRPAGKDYAGEGAEACFIPHHYFRYFDAAGQQVGEIEICFCCAGGQSQPALAGDHAVHYDIEAIKRLVKGMMLPTEVGC